MINPNISKDELLKKAEELQNEVFDLKILLSNAWKREDESSKNINDTYNRMTKK